MGFDIPEPFCWDESFKVFYETLDEQHKGLFQGVFALAGSKDAPALSHLIDIVQKHFATEEEMMQAKKFSDYGPHKQAHDDFVAKIKGLSAPVGDDIIHFAKDWLVNHIKGTDFKYKGQL